MHGYSMQLMDGPSVLITMQDNGWNTRRDSHPLSQDLSALLNSAATPVFVVIDVQTYLSFDDVVYWANVMTREPRAFLTHPKMREALIVTTDPLVTRVGHSLNTDIYGNIAARDFREIDEALRYIEVKLRES